MVSRDGEPDPTVTARNRAFDRRRARPERLRQVGMRLDTARCLEHRAGRAAGTVLADVLREQARERRRRAERRSTPLRTTRG